MDRQIRIMVVAALAENNAIGKNNQLLWHIREDLKHFKALTFGSPILMGRKTYESIGKPLPGRQNIVLSRQAAPRLLPETVYWCHTWDEAISCARAPIIYVVGGSEIYQLALPVADRLYLTRVQKSFEADAFFPDWDRKAFERVASEEHFSEEAGLGFVFETYERLPREPLAETKMD